MAPHLQYRTHDSCGTICKAERYRRISGNVPCCDPAWCDSGSRRSLFSKAVAILQPERRMDQKGYLDPLVQGAGSRTACSHHRTSF